MKKNELAIKILNLGKGGYENDEEGFRKLDEAKRLIDEYVNNIIVTFEGREIRGTRIEGSNLHYKISKK